MQDIQQALQETSVVKQRPSDGAQTQEGSVWEVEDRMYYQGGVQKHHLGMQGWN